MPEIVGKPASKNAVLAAIPLVGLFLVNIRQLSYLNIPRYASFKYQLKITQSFLQFG